MSMSEQRAGAGSRDIAIWLILVGGALAVLGSFLPWAKVVFGPNSQTAKGFDGWEGKVTAIAGAALIICAIAIKQARNRRLAPWTMLLGLAAAGISLYDILTLKTQAITSGASDISKSTGVPVDQVKATLHLLLVSGTLKVSLEFGILIVLVGGILGILGGLMLTLAKEPQVATPVGSTPRAPDGGFAESWVMTPASTPAPAPPPAPSGMTDPAPVPAPAPMPSEAQQPPPKPEPPASPEPAAPAGP